MEEMKRFFIILITLCVGSAFGKWHEDYQAAYEKAKRENKSIFLFFTGSDYCAWCKKLSNEILDTSDFKNLTDKYFEFVYIDFPAKKALSDKQYKNNKKLKEKYGVEGFPTVIIIDTDEIVVTRTGYLPVGPKEYAKKIIQLVEEHNSLKKKDFSGVDLHDLKTSYEKARAYGNDFIKEKTLNEGIKKDERLYFLLEKYVYLTEKQKNDEAREVKREILENDPHNLRKTYFRLAMIDFEVLAKDKSIVDPNIVIYPLVQYIAEFGKKDKDNLWRLEMLISQFLCSKGLIKEALEHARQSYKAAPSELKKELVQTVLYLKQKVQEQ
jgi:protein disulfide-isomerase